MFRNAIVFAFISLVFLMKGQKGDGPVAKYSFNKGNANDEVGHNNAKAYGASLVEDRFGNPLSAYYFQGNFDNYINLGTSDLLKPKKATFSFWINVHSQMGKGYGTETNMIIFTRAHLGENCNEAFGVAHDLNTKNLAAFCSLSEREQVSAYSFHQPTLAKWHHIVFTYDNKFLSFYIDGNLENQVVKKFETSFLTGDSIILGGRVSKKNASVFHGCIDDIEIYDRVLSPDEVIKLFHAPNPNKGKVILEWIFICLLVLASVFLIVWFVKRRINKVLTIEKEKNQLRNNWYEQENKVLMAQMDPHFIFNSLNTIQQFIIINDNDKAQLYLTKFSRLLRMILESNVKDRISLKEEIEIIQQYLEIESLRFNNVFKYRIRPDIKMDLQSIHIPRFLIQPFVENAIWHGLLPKDGDKQLEILFEIADEKTLTCTVEDNGIGRNAAQKKESKENKSLAISFIEQRLQLLSKLYKAEYKVIIIDKMNTKGESTGTKINVTIPILNT